MGLHRRYEQILQGGHHHATLDKKDEEKVREKLAKAFRGMMSALFREKGATLDLQLLASDEAQRFINTHAATLDKAFERVPMSDRMRQRLQRSDYIFSGIKTFHELNEAFPSLLDENGNRKPFEQFLNDVQKIDKTYNQHYLQAEYNFVNASAEMAAKWEQYAQDGDRYNLQYRTAGDERVRPEHAALNGVTLPQSDPFWETYYPPNGWNCRCTVVQVRKSKYATTPRDEAMARGEEALQSDTKGIFRFNSGKQEKAIPDYNAYTIKRCRNCVVAKGDAKGKLAKDVEPQNTDLCHACQVIRAQQTNINNAKEILKKYPTNKWEHTYIGKENHGYVATELDRIKESKASPNETRKFNKEMRMCKVLADNGHNIEYLSGSNREKGQTYDIRIDGIKADLKCVGIDSGAGNVVKYVRKAFKEQGADAIVLEIPRHDSDFYEALAEARRKYDGKIFFYFSDDYILKEIIKNEAVDKRPRGGTRPCGPVPKSQLN